MEAFPRSPTTCFLGTMWTEANSHLKLFAFCWPTRSSTQRISFSYVGTMSVHPSTGFMDSMMNVSGLDTHTHTHTHTTHAHTHTLTETDSTGKRRYNIRLWKVFTDCFNCLPVAAILDEKIFCCHGGERGGMECSGTQSLPLYRTFP